MLKQALLKNGSITFFSRILGFIRDIAMAQVLGASWQLDAFLIAFKLPNFFRRLFVEGVFTQVLLPAAVSSSNQQVFLSNVYGLLCLVLLMVSIPFVFWPHQVLSLILYGMQETPVFKLAVVLLPIVFPYLFFISACGFFNVQLNLKEKFSLGFALPLVLNSVLIFGVLWFNGDVVRLAQCVFVAGWVQFIVLGYVVYDQGGVVMPIFPWIDCSMLKLLQQASIAFLAQVLMYLSANVDLFLMSFLPAGSVSWLYYTDRLIYLPVGVVSVTLASILMPKLSIACHHRHYEQVSRVLSKGLQLIVCVAVPVMISIICFAEEIVSLLFQSNSFTMMDIQATSLSLRIAALALPALMINRVWVSYLYADSQVVFQVKMTGIAVVSATCVSVLCMKYLGHASLTLGLLVGSWMQCIGYLWLTFSRLNLNYIDTMLKRFTKAVIGVGVFYCFMYKVFPHVEGRWMLLGALMIKGGVPFISYCYWNIQLLSWCVTTSDLK